MRYCITRPKWLACTWKLPWVINPIIIPLLKIIGDYYELIGEQEQAAEIFSRILELYPGEPDSLIYKQKILTYTENKTMP